ncbi:MAG: hypothetical protein Q9224_003502 [Gallowayella concinna]
MAKAIEPSTYRNGYHELVDNNKKNGGLGYLAEKEKNYDEKWNVEGHYQRPPSAEVLSSSAHNDFGLNIQRVWPTLHDGTNSPHPLPKWWNPQPKTDVLICGDKATAPLTAGRADGVQPRFLEMLHSWGLASEVHEEGPLIERTAIYKDGKKIFFARSHQSDSRYRGLHIITQAQLERIYIRDLMRHRSLVERSTVITDYNVHSSPASEPSSYPVQVTLRNERTGKEEVVQAKYLVGCDGAASMVRKKLGIPFEGVSTDIYWGIMDCVFETDYPHAWVFGSVVSSQYGGCVIIPREDGYIRLYTQLDLSTIKDFAQSQHSPSKDVHESGGRIDTSSIQPEHVLAQANRIFAPYKVKFAAPLSWFAIWKISERVARSFSSPDLRVHLAGDAAHVHSVMGAFGLNASMMDSSNLAWKLGLCARNLANQSTLAATYDQERRPHAQQIIRISGSYLRFVCQSEIPVTDFEHGVEPFGGTAGAVDYVPGQDLEFLGEFFRRNGKFILGVDAPYPPSAISPTIITTVGVEEAKRPIGPRNGVRAPNPRVCRAAGATGYLYDVLTGVDTIHIVLFASDLQGAVRAALTKVSRALDNPGQFFQRYGAATRFNVVLVVKCCLLLPDVVGGGILAGAEFSGVEKYATVLYDDRPPDEDAHTMYEIDHGKGAVVVVRPDLWVGFSAFLDEVERVDGYFGSWLLPVDEASV